MKTPNSQLSLKQVRAVELHPDRILRALSQFGVVSIRTPPGVGKTYAAIRAAVTNWQGNENAICVIATESKSKIRECSGDLIAQGVPPELICTLTGLTVEDCPHFEERQADLKLGLIARASALCRECRTICAQKEVKGKLKNAPFGKFILTTHHYLLRSQFLKGFLKNHRVLIIIDEDAVFLPIEGVTYQELSFTDIRTIADKLISCDYENLRMTGTAAEMAILNLQIPRNFIAPSLSEEQFLLENNIRNIYPEIETIMTQKLIPFDRRYRFSQGIPRYDNQMLIAAVAVPPRFISKRLGGVNVHEICLNDLPLPPGTAITRVRTPMTSICRFHGSNLDRVAFSFAWLISDRHKKGLRGVVVCKKQVQKEVIAKINQDLELLSSEARLVRVPDHDGDSPDMIPVLTFGVKALNAFTHFDYAFCVNSFNTTEQILTTHLDFYYDFRCHYKVRLNEEHGVRTIGTNIPAEERSVAQELLHLYETTTIVQAIGRIRPFTLPGKEVIIMQKSPVHSGETVLGSYKEFSRQYHIPGKNSFLRDIAGEKVHSLAGQGFGKTAIAEVLNISRQSVYNHLNKGGVN